ncbi:class I SAM-dependent methyltransferase [Actinomycetospora termitidis]|uniref:Class I SAM-dependent methyltransferase n=1 Tax=Actinomycetospora termitidis TaxID=3053470 RepID=A0ABT7MEY3_9PSEU|nr:class I SAM-dependent methyltransferase [Actinomycetospora sp. Odt1-22]MDL5158996.1 class I SAM-dependent methyltransferase [Actinomycetospora sp. Odt1-22]
MTPSGLPYRVRHQLRIVQAAGFDLRPGARILDLGCGEGATVSALRDAGYDAVGAETVLRDSVAARDRFDEGLVRQIDLTPYRLPFEDGEFDLILSSEVLEHVMDYEDLVRESHRVQKPGGMSMHIFPGRWMPVEGHLFVPLATVHRSYPWLLLWARLGVRNQYQRGEHYRDVARFNYTWLREQTNYPTTATVRRLFERRFATVEFREDLFLTHTESSRGRAVHRAVRAAPVLLGVYRTLWNRVLVARRENARP